MKGKKNGVSVASRRPVTLQIALRILADVAVPVSFVLLASLLFIPVSIEVLGGRFLTVGILMALLLFTVTLAKIPLQGIRSLYWLYTLCIFGAAVHFFAATFPGYGADIGFYQRWVVGVLKLGVPGTYEQIIDDGMLPNYPPLLLYILWGVGHLYRWIVAPEFDYAAQSFYTLFKLPGTAFDILTGILIFAIVRRYRGKRAAYLAAAIALLHPVALHNSAVWGQTDAIYTFFVTATLAAWLWERWLLTGILCAMALLMKVQAVFFLPLLLLLCLARIKVLWRIALGGLITFAIAYAPFAIHGNLLDGIGIYTRSVGFYSSLSLNAYNVWWALFGPNNLGGDQGLLFGFVSFRMTGLLLFAGTSAVFLWLVRSSLLRKNAEDRSRAAAVFVTAAFLSLSFFVFNTEMHERYLFPFVILGIPLIFLGSRGIAIYILGSACAFLNLLGVVSIGPWDRWLFSTFPNFSSFIAAMHVFLLFLFLAFTPRFNTSIVSPLKNLKGRSSTRAEKKWPLLP